MKRLLLIPLSFACSPKDAPGEAPPELPSVAEPRRVEDASANDPEPTLPPPSVDGFYMAPGAPQAQGCKTAGECMGGTIPVLDNPCCNDPLSLRPYAREYHAWIGKWRSSHCADVVCPPPPPPSEPPKCAFEVDCVDGRCVDNCDW